MSSHTYDYLDGNAAAGELSKIFAVDVTGAEGQCAHKASHQSQKTIENVDVTGAEGQCAHCGATKHFAEAHVYMQGPGVVARCASCEQVLLRLVNVRQRVLLDVRGMTYLSLDTSQLQESSRTTTA